MANEIIISGAREHNLKNISLRLPRDKMIVITGLSGSGKSSLAFDTIYAEGQRRYVESLSAYARQFLGQMQKPDIDSIEGLSPAISIDQRAISKNPRSTVGTVTEIYDYLRLLYARIGKPHCPSCGKLISAQSQQQIVDQILEMEEGTRFIVVAPLIRGRKGEHRDLLEQVRRDGFTRVKIDGDVKLLDEDIHLDKNIRHDISVVVDRLVLKEDVRHRLADSVETAAALSGGLVNIETDGKVATYSEQFSCPDCGVSLAELAPRIFSFNSPYGACEHCTGLGFQEEIDIDLLIPDKSKTLREANILPWSSGFRHVIRWMSRYYDVSLDVPFKKLSKNDQQLILYGPSEETKKKIRGRKRSSRVLTGIIPNLERRYRETESSFMRERISQLMAIHPCPVCHGARLKAESLAVTVGDMNIYDLSCLPIKNSEKFLGSLELTETEQLIGGRVIKEIRERLRFLDNVGVGYLTLQRMAGTLSGGEGQRIRLATQIGSSLVGVLYILDEPSIGLHQRDNRKLIDTLHRLRDLGNTVIVVEHDEETMREADYIVDMGPGAGERGGEIVAEGPPEKILKSKKSLTAAFLNGKRFINVPERRSGDNGSIIIRGAREHNLKAIDVEIPLGKFVCVTGVSGSGKSTLINDVLYRSLAGSIYRAKAVPGAHDGIDGTEQLDKIINIDQSPIGRTPRSNPATYTGVFDHIRNLFAVTPEARVRGYKPGRFSFNVRGGRCEACRGEGTIKIEMHFLPDIYVPCEVCKGRRYDRETLEVRFKGKNIAEVLDMSAATAAEFFEAIPRIARRMQTMVDVGLGYIRLGQPATTLSGGEAQRVKLASELNKVATGSTLYILDEPTTGLHFADIEKLLDVLQRLVDTGNTVVVIEHNLDVIKCADQIIDLGPEGGDEGGYVIATGTPEELVKQRRSETGRALRPILRA
ncbi:MAG: excinuclease ABC subunit UvrA [Actinobacteria bacterium]|nr:excinuclease ABC subunit UvrA [Actinomycetota bacterium]MCL5882672.1 excinuclease ABC subunit UvrA [Actinomycetota bacterium]